MSRFFIDIYLWFKLSQGLKILLEASSEAFTDVEVVFVVQSAFRKSSARHPVLPRLPVEEESLFRVKPTPHLWDRRTPLSSVYLRGLRPYFTRLGDGSMRWHNAHLYRKERCDGLIRVLNFLSRFNMYGSVERLLWSELGTNVTFYWKGLIWLVNIQLLFFSLMGRV